MLKVLYISPNGYLGGAERFVLTAVLGHNKKNNINASVLFFSDGEACKEAEKLGINHLILNNSFRVRNPWKLFLALREIRRLVVQLGPDVLHLTMPYSHIVLSLATLGLNIKKIWFQHGPVGGRLDQIANCFPVDMILYNSSDLQKRHHQTWPRSTVRVQESIINLGVKANCFSRQLFSNPVLIFGTAGRICSWKGFHNIVMALGELKKEQILKSYRFVIAGASKSTKDAEYEKGLLALVQSLKLTKEVVFLEHVENMDAFYQSLDVFVHASVIPEPFGLVVAEAMINGCLVIGSDSGGVGDLLQDRATGITFSSTSTIATKQLRNIFEEILGVEDNESFDIYRDIAEAGRAFVEKNYSVEQMVTQLENLYFQLMGKEY